DTVDHLVAFDRIAARVRTHVFVQIDPTADGVRSLRATRAQPRPAPRLDAGARRCAIWSGRSTFTSAGSAGGRHHEFAGPTAATNSALLSRQQFPRLGWRRRGVAKQFDDPDGLLDQRRIAWRQPTLAEVDVVLQPDPHVSAEQHRLRHHGELMERY